MDTDEKRILRIAVCAARPGQVPNYLSALTQLGAAPELLNEIRDPERYDCLLLPGGADVDPQRYGQELNGSLGVDPALDALQFTALECFLRAGKPILGICRGHQLLNVFFGGTLIQHLPTAQAHTRGGDDETLHPVRAEPGSFMDALYGREFTVNSSHHQASDRMGEGLVPVLWAQDGTVEAAYHRTLPVWSVQWHPERLCFGFSPPGAADGSRVLEFFLKQCR